MFNIIRRQIRIGGTNGFVGLLCAFLRGVTVWLFRQIVRAKLPGNKMPRRINRFIRQMRAVRSHIGYQPQSTHRAKVDALVKLLGDPHGAFGGKSHTVGCGLLQRRGNKRWGGFGFDPAGNNIRDRVCGFFQIGQRCFGVLLVINMELLAVNTNQFSLKCTVLGQPLVLFYQGASFVSIRCRVQKLLPCRGQIGLCIRCKDRWHQPVFFRVKNANFAFPQDDDLDGNGLHSSGTQAASNLFPQKRTDLIPNNPVQNPPGLLCHHTIHIDLAGIFEGLFNSVLGDRVKHDAIGIFVFEAQAFFQMPCNRLPLTVKVSRQINLIAFLR